MNENTKEVNKEEKPNHPPKHGGHPHPKHHNLDSEVGQFLHNYKLTKKAEFLYKNGFSNEPIQLETMQGYTEVTHNDGFKGFSVYTKEGKLFISKPETDEAESIFSYNVIQLADASEEEVRELKRIKNIEDKSSAANILKLLSLVTVLFGFVFLVIYIIQVILAYGVLEGFVYAAGDFLTLGVAIGVLALVFKKRN